MRKLLILLLVGAGLWSGYWFVGSSALRSGAEQWFVDQKAQGLTAEKTALSVVGFPNRFDLTIEGLALADPQTGTGWRAPFVQIFAMTWKPWHIIAALPPEQVVSLPDEEITLTSDGLRASLRAKPATDLPLAAVIVESGSFTALSDRGWTLAADQAVASISADEEVEGAGDAANAYVLALDITDLSPDPQSIEKIVAEAGLPPQISLIRVLATATLTAPLDRHAGEIKPRLAGLALSEGRITWGDLSATATGTIAPDDQGYAAGRIEIAVTNWQRMIPALVAVGAITPQLSQTVENMMAALAKETGDPNVLKLPLILSEGRMSLGPLPLGEAPLLLPPSG